MGYNIGPTIAVKGESDFNAAMVKIKANMKLVASEAGVMAAQFQGSEKSTEALTAKGKVLASALDQQKQAVKEAENALKRMKEGGVDPSSTAYVSMETNLNNARAAMISTEREIKKNEDALRSANRQTSDFSNGWKNFASGAGRMAVGALRSIAVAAGAVAVAAGAALISATKVAFEFNKEMEGYATNFEVMLGSYELAIQKTDELKKLAASTPFAMADLAQGTQTLLAFGVSNKLSTSYLKMTGDIALGNAEKFQRLNLALGKAQSLGKLTGETYQQMVEAGFNPLSIISKQTGESMEELQKRMSSGKVSVEELISAMSVATSKGGQFYQGMEKASQTTDGLISTLKDNAKTLLGSVLSPITESIRTDYLPAIIGYVGRLQEAFDLSGFTGLTQEAGNIAQEVSKQINKSIPSVIESISSKLPNLIQMLTDTLTTFAASAATAIPALLPILFGAAMQLFSGVLSAIQQNAQPISDAIIQVMNMMVQFLTVNLPLIASTGMTILMALAQGLVDNLPQIMPQIYQMIFQIADMLTQPEQLTQLITVGIKLTVAMVQGFIEAQPQIIAAALQVVVNLLITFAQLAPQLWESGKEFIVQLGEGIWAQFSELFAVIGEWAQESILQPIADLAKSVVSIGRNIVEGVWEGITNSTAWIYDKISGWVGSVLDWIKRKFGIRSPSTLMRDEVGKYLAMGVGVGITDNIGYVKTAMQGMIDVTSGAIGNVGSSVTANGSSAPATQSVFSPVFNIYARDKDTGLEVADATVAMLQQARWVTA